MHYIIRDTIRTPDPIRAAIYFQTLLAVDKGFTSTVEADGTSRIVVGSDGQAVKFVKWES